jgi:hypothetical protein
VALVALAALAGPAGCKSGQIIEDCPGTDVVLLSLVATRTTAACQGDTAPADGDAACAASQIPSHCQLERPVPSCCFDGLFPVTRAFQATIAYGALDASAAFCLPVPGASPYVGTRTSVGTGEQLSVSVETSGAVLASCSSTCAVTVLHSVTGLVEHAVAGGPVTGFTGELVEAASPTPASSCTPCTAPCTATWALGPPPPPGP